MRWWLALGFVLIAQKAEALSLDVTITTDGDDGMCTYFGNCTLREAFDWFDSEVGPHDINLVSGTYQLTEAWPIFWDGGSDNVVVTGQGPGVTIIDGGGATRADNIFEVECGGCTFTFRNLTIRNGVTNATTSRSEDGPAIRARAKVNLVLDNVTIENNSAPQGIGAVLATSTSGTAGEQGSLVVTNSRFIDNETLMGGALVVRGEPATLTGVTFTNNRATIGGALMALDLGGVSVADVTIARSLFFDNHATAGDGGAIHSSGDIAITNTTFSANTATANGGAIFQQNTNPASVELSTFFGNTAASGGALHLGANGTFAVASSLFVGSGCSGTITSGGYSVLSGGSCTGTIATDVTTSDPRVLALSQGTHALGFGSVACDGAAPGATATVDQRGNPRPVGTRRDVGAYESETADLQVTLAGPSTGVSGAALSYVLTVSNGGDTFASSVTVELTFGDGVTPVTLPNECSGTTCTFANVAVGTPVMKNVVVRGNAPGTISLQARVTGTFCDSNMANNLATVTPTLSAPPPAITSVTPSVGATTGGEAITIKGSGFLPGATVLFGATAAGNVVVVDSETITCFAPPGTDAGGVNVTVRNSDGLQAVAAIAYTYFVPEDIDNVGNLGDDDGDNAPVIARSGCACRSGNDGGLWLAALLLLLSRRKLLSFRGRRIYAAADEDAATPDFGPRGLRANQTRHRRDAAAGAKNGAGAVEVQ